MTRLPRWLRDRRVTFVVFAGTLVWVAAVYVVVVLGGGALIGQTDSPNLALSVLATAIVALGFEPARARLEHVAEGWFHHGHKSPYDVLSQFSDSVVAVSGDLDPTQLPMRMARLLAEGTGARWAQVWLVVDGDEVLAATWPADATEARSGAADPPPEGIRSLDVLLGDDRLGLLTLQEQRDRPLSQVEERLFAGLAAQAGLVLRGSRLRAELSRRADELAARTVELQESRERLVDVHDEERRSLERDIHDGAQQHLVALVVNLRLAQSLASRAPERASRVLREQGDAVDAAIATLLDLSRGIYPRTLSDSGIAAAVLSVVGTSAVPVRVIDQGIGRSSEEVEAAVYFCCVEAVQNAVKHAQASSITVEFAVADDELVMSVKDDGLGFDPDAVVAGDGLGNMRDRIDSVRGTFALRRGADGGTEAFATVPLAPRTRGT
jgi:signal transduction histidine kinase